MTVEEKAKAYDEAIERVKNFIENGDERERTIAESIFAGIMEESEDERVRKELLDYFKNRAEKYPNDPKYKNISAWIAWLEKQGEQKPVDKVEPKFHEGEWIVRNGKTLQISHIDKVLDGTFHYWFTVGTWLSSAKMEVAHLWTIQDAKDGDVLACPNDAGDRDVVFIFKNINSDEGWVFCFCAIDANGCFCTNNDYVGNSNSTNISPATKEQRDLLFQKMKEAGYEWDADAKVLKEIEQKSAEWTKEDIQMYRNILSYLSEPSPLKEVNGKSREQLLDWFKGFKDRYTWKPSEEQIKAVRLARSFVTDDFDEHPALSEILIELEEQLKKLK